MSGYVTSAPPVKQLKPKKNPKNQQYYQPKDYLDFYLHGKSDTRRGVCLSSEKYKLFADISNSWEKQDCIIKKVKLIKDKFDFILADYTTITRSKLDYEKVTQSLGYTRWSSYISAIGEF